MTTYTSRETYQFISRQTNDPIVEWKTCTVSGQPFPIYQSDVDFYEKISPTFDGKKFLIPTPTLCPEERQRRRLAFRNERKLYRRTCDFSGKEIISMYSPDKPFKVYEQEILWSDQWNPLDYGKDINWNVSFFQQFNELLHTIPLPSLITKMSENCKYVNNCGNSKNSYLIFDSDFCENSLYSSIVKYSNSVLDSLHIYHCENIYNSINCTESYHLINCFECDRSKFLRNCSKCINCEYCYGCSNLVYKKYCIYNQPYSQEEYEKRILEIPFTYEYPSSLSRTTYVLNSEESIGNNLWNTKQCHFSFNVGDAEQLKYCDLVTGAEYCFDISSYGGNLHYSYQNCSVGFDVSKTFFSAVITSNAHDIYYSHLISGSHDIFGCIGLLNASYCILNKQYTKEEYETLVPKIIEKMQENGEWGEFFPPSLSPFGYNETVAQEYFPLTKETSGLNGYKRNDFSSDPKIPTNAELLYPAQLPDEERNALVNDDSVLKKVIICKESQRPFIIQKLELDFYRKMRLPLPKLHPDVRHEARMKQRPGRTLHLRHCDKCGKEMVSVYPADDEKKVYCEDCYRKEVYG